MSRFIVKGSTTDSEIASTFKSEEILERFARAKEYSNRWDTERDRLRKFIQDRMEPGRYGKYILDISEGSPRVYVNKEGNQMVLNGVIVDAGLLHQPIKGGIRVRVVDLDGEILAEGETVANSTLFTRKPPLKIDLTEVPNESESKE